MSGLIGSGKIHVHTVAEIARAQLLDGPQLPSIAMFASLGNYGLQKGHEERDLHRWLQNLHGIALEPYWTTMLLQARKSKIGHIISQMS